MVSNNPQMSIATRRCQTQTKSVTFPFPRNFPQQLILFWCFTFLLSVQLLQTVPPLYYPENMTTPTVIFSGGMDWLADPKDVKKLLPRIPNLVSNTFIAEYDHLDFIWGLSAADKVYKPIIKQIGLAEAGGKHRFSNRWCNDCAVSIL